MLLLVTSSEALVPRSFLLLLAIILQAQRVDGWNGADLKHRVTMQRTLRTSLRLRTCLPLYKPL